MVTIQLPVDPEKSARLAFLAELREQRKVEVALDTKGLSIPKIQGTLQRNGRH